MTEQTRGQCLCGAVTFSISGGFDAFFLCHCSRCRKDSGSAHSANLFASGATIIWASGQKNVRLFRLGATRHMRCFCTICGSALPFSQGAGGGVVVPAGSLDSPVGIRPTAHICMSSRASWDNDLDAVERIAGVPG